MAWLIKKKLKDGGFNYYIAYREKRGKKSVIRTKTTKTDKAPVARKLLQRFEDSQENEVGLRKVLMSDFYPSYIRFSEKQKSPRTTKLEKFCIENLLNTFSDFYLDAFTKGMVEEYKMTRIETVSPTSVNLELRMLRSIFSYAVEQNYLKSNPFSRFKKFKEPRSDSLPVFMKIEEVNKFLDVIKAEGDHQYWRYVNFLFRTGSRREEILYVEKEHIDLENRLIMLTRTKTGVPRYVPIDDILYEIIQEIPVESGRIFDYHADTLSHKFTNYLKKAGIDGNYSLKTTRKTFASHLVMRGVDLTAVQELLGHSDPKITRDHYAKLAPDHLQQSIKKLPY